MGNISEVQRYDEKMAAAAGLMDKSLTVNGVEKHLSGFGIEPEQATHTLISSLSGGQKVKVVLAASLWLNPHLIILDEPTNYLDRDSLGALAAGIKKYEGGVILISHNSEFTNNICSEKWIVNNGKLIREGDEQNDEKINQNIEISDTVLDSMGNEIKVKKEKVLTAREKKKLEKKKAERRKKGLPSESDEDY